jgi:hypothetical protein
MSIADRILQLVELLLLCLCLIVTEIHDIKVGNLEKELKARTDALRYEVGESEERCRRLTDTCIDIVNRKIYEGGNYAD